MAKKKGFYEQGKEVHRNPEEAGSGFIKKKILKQISKFR